MMSLITSNLASITMTRMSKVASMKQSVKTTIRWKDNEGNVLGAFRETQLDLPAWGKLRFLRDEARSFIKELLTEAKSDNPRSFADYAFNALRNDRIFWIKSKTDGSVLTIKGDDVASFLNGGEK